MDYKVVRRFNEWSYHGERINVRDEILLDTDDLEAAFRLRVARHVTNAWDAKTYVNVLVLDENNQSIELIDLYRLIVGEETFQAQLNDDDFSINLDDWFRSRMSSDEPVSPPSP